jgi:hypothetical protein
MYTWRKDNGERAEMQFTESKGGLKPYLKGLSHEK